MGSRNRNKTKKFWKRIYARRYRRLLRREKDGVSKGHFRRILTGHRWYDLND